MTCPGGINTGETPVAAAGKEITDKLFSNKMLDVT